MQAVVVDMVAAVTAVVAVEVATVVVAVEVDEIVVVVTVLVLVVAMLIMMHKEKTKGDYYLARFKDAYRQATIDLMLGNQVSPESLNALGGQQVPGDNDALDSAEHAKLLVEDCRRLLLGAAQYPIGSWGLIDADPSSGDMNETEVDIILLLADNCYIVADYDSHLDKIVRFEKVLLQNMTMIELGMYQQTQIFQGTAPALLCMRLNYMVDGTHGYFHMFRSANIRFFNNVAVVIKTQEEVLESLMAIVEFFKITLDNIGKSDVRFITGGMLESRKNKVPLLDVPKGMQRNLSESQLVQMSSKALSNVAGQFSKLGHSFNPNKAKLSTSTQQNNKTTQLNPQVMGQNQPVDSCMEAEKAVFSLGPCKKPKSSPGSSDSEDNDSSIYEPESESVEMPEIAIEVSCEKAGFNESDFLPSVGIVMCPCLDQAIKSNVNQLEVKDNIAKMSEDVSTISITSVTDHVSLSAGLLGNAAPVRALTPEIRVQGAPSQSSDGVVTPEEQSRPVSPRDLSLPTGAAPQPDGTLRQLKTFTSPLSKLAKGVHSFGMNLDPRKIGMSGVLSPSQNSSAENSPPELQRSIAYKDNLEKMWADNKCHTKLVAL